VNESFEIGLVFHATFFGQDAGLRDVSGIQADGSRGSNAAAFEKAATGEGSICGGLIKVPFDSVLIFEPPTRFFGLIGKVWEEPNLLFHDFPYAGYISFAKSFVGHMQ